MSALRTITDTLATIVAGAVLATGRAVVAWRGSAAYSYGSYRQDLGRAILLGLEFLIAGDIIRTVVIAPTLENVLILGIIVIIRTFPSVALQLEIDGRLPWQRGEPVAPARGDRAAVARPDAVAQAMRPPAR